MTFPEETALKPVTLTQPAANAVREVMQKKNLSGYALRLSIFGTGCSGYQYGLALDNNVEADDTVSETDGIKLIVDDVSIRFLQGATVDYIEDLTNSGFKIINPNLISSCNCGQSDSSSEADSSGNCSDCE